MIDSDCEAELARQATSGEREALRRLYEEYSDQLFAVAYRLTHSSADARDILHDVFSRLPRALRSFDHERAVGPWLRRVTVRTALISLRRQARRREVAIPRDDLPGRPPSVLDSIALERALAALPETLRSVIILKEIEGYSHKEIGKLLGIASSASAVRLCRARAMLRASLRER